MILHVPFDDRRAFEATFNDLQFAYVREYLHDIGSNLRKERDTGRIYMELRLAHPQSGYQAPRNVALLFFNDDPGHWFRGARIEAVRFPDDASGDILDEQFFTGPIAHHIRQCLIWINGSIIHRIEKQERGPESKTFDSYPEPALREALVNAIYHRDYEYAVEPTKIYWYPDRVEVISYPGPIDGIETEHLQGTAPLPPIPARNRRIGEFLKELRLAEGRGTGLPKIYSSMKANGSPPPLFDFDKGRSYFRITLPIHPNFSG